MSIENKIRTLPCLDTREMANQRAIELDFHRQNADDLRSTVKKTCETGVYRFEWAKENADGLSTQYAEINLKPLLDEAIKNKINISADTQLPQKNRNLFAETLIQVTNETTLGAAKRLTNEGKNPLVLNFATGIIPGISLFHEARLQEHVLCRSSVLNATLNSFKIYISNKVQGFPSSTDWAIYSPQVPVFRNADGTELGHRLCENELVSDAWCVNVISCVAPFSSSIVAEGYADLLRQEIDRVLAIAEAYEYTELVLCAWGCGTFRPSLAQQAADFRNALENGFSGVFKEVVFAIPDWTPQRKFLGPFRDEFAIYSEFCSIKKAMAKSIVKIEAIYETEGAGIEDKSASFELGEVVAIDGSNRFARDIAISYIRHLVFQYEVSVFIVNCNPLINTTLNLVSDVSNIDRSKMFSAKLEDDDWPKLTTAINILADKNIQFFEVGDYSTESVLGKFRALCQESDDGKFFLIDTHAIFDSEGNSKTEFLSALKCLAKEFNCSAMVIL